MKNRNRNEEPGPKQSFGAETKRGAETKHRSRKLILQNPEKDIAECQCRFRVVAIGGQGDSEING